MTVLVRTDGEPSRIVPDLRAAVRRLDPDLALARVAPLDALVDGQIAPRRFNTWLLSAFGVVAVALTAIGLYSLLAYLVALRRREMAVRLSIGATSRHVLGLVVRDVAATVAIGTSLGLVGGMAAAVSMRGLLFGITPSDPVSHAVTLLMLGTVAVAAACVPLRRAMRIDPATVLRIE
jgi:ABC-type antimicrobial peptide transport system permease subunit